MTSSAPRSVNRRKLLVSILAPVFAFLALLSWGLASPAGASPDDDFHLASIWCGHGPSEMCGTTDVPEERVVYRDLIDDSVCFAWNPDTSAACQGDDFGQNPGDLATTERVNRGGYPPVYYFVMSWFASPNIEASVLAMKAVNSLLFVGIVGALFALLPLHRRPTLMWSLLVSVVPLAMFLIPSVNPSSWAILSAGTLWLSFLGFMETTGKRKLGLGILAVVATIMGAGARGDAAMYSVLAVALVLGMTFRKSKAFWRDALLGVGLVAIAAFFYLTSGQKDAIGTGLSQGAPNLNPVDPILLGLGNLINVPSLWVGVFGTTALGWFDTHMPASVWVAAFACFCGVVFLGLRTRVRRKGIALAILLAAIWLIPTVLLVQSQSIVGENFQPRYILPLIVMLAGFLLLQSSSAKLETSALQRTVVVVALSLANSLALFTNMRRYITGVDVTSPNLDQGVEWWWNIAVSPLTVWAIGSLAFAGIAILINSTLVSGDHETEKAPRPDTVFAFETAK